MKSIPILAWTVFLTHLASPQSNAQTDIQTDTRAAGDLPSHLIDHATQHITIDGILDETDWQNAATVDPFLFPWWEAGEQENTQARLLWDDEALYVSFVAHDQHIWATYVNRDDPVSRDDAVEVFVAPDTSNAESYFNFEFNAIGTILDRSPRNGRSSSWNASDIEVAITIDGSLNDDGDTDNLWTTEIAIPFSSFEGYAPQLPPQAGSVWRLNLYRIGGRTNPQFSVWSDTQTPAPQYHVPSRFGIVRFSGAGPVGTVVNETSLGVIKAGIHNTP